MVRYQSLICDDEERRAQLLGHATLNGIDYIEVSEDQKTLHVYFMNPLPPDAYGLPSKASLIRIRGGVRIRNIQVEAVNRASSRRLEVTVSEPGDFSTYTLVIEGDSAWLDPAYAQVEFSFKAGCPSRFDCRSSLVCPTEPRTEPLIDYMAKDYASFRQALLDLIPTLVPDWRDRHEADLGLALVELLAYTGDQLSYYQDAVANEAYLETARQRISVRRHARLIDYPLHDGASARAFVHLQLKPGTSGALPKGTQILTRVDVPLRSHMPPHGPVIPAEVASQALQAAHVVYEAFEAVELHAKLNELEIHAWGNRQCCLPRGTTTLDLIGDLAADPDYDPPTTWKLKPGDFLLIEEIKGPVNGRPVDANPDHRQVVRLTKVEKTKDPLLDEDLTRVTWDAADKLTFPLCVSARLTDGPRKGEHEPKVSVARGNLVLADHGHTLPEEEYPGPEKGIHPHSQRAHRIRLKHGPVSFRVPRPGDDGTLSPASELFTTDPRSAIPQVRLTIPSDVWPDEWEHPGVPHLFESDPFDQHFVVETDNDSRAVIRFGHGQYGMAPPEDVPIRVIYRVGVGMEGHVGAESLVHIVEPAPLPSGWPDIARVSPELRKPVRNPLPAWGGIDPESIEQVKHLAPAAFHAEQFRAVTEEDYARMAEKHPRVDKAAATFRWTGSWHTVFIAVDPKGQNELDPELERRVRDWVTRYTLAGYDLEIDGPIYVPLEIEIDVCVGPEYFRAHVEEALLMALGNRVLPDGSKGFFHPDRHTFGQPLYLSQLYAALEAVEGVDSAAVRRFVRRETDDPEPGRPATWTNVERGYIPMGRLEVLRLDNDPSLPENGVLALNMLGGK